MRKQRWRPGPDPSPQDRTIDSDGALVAAGSLEALFREFRAEYASTRYTCLLDFFLPYHSVLSTDHQLPFTGYQLLIIFLRINYEYLLILTYHSLLITHHVANLFRAGGGGGSVQSLVVRGAA